MVDIGGEWLVKPNIWLIDGFRMDLMMVNNCLMESIMVLKGVG